MGRRVEFQHVPTATFAARDRIPRPVNAVGVHMVTGGIESDFHTHRQAQLCFLERGEMTCEVASALWLIPPQSALWIPGGLRHKVKGRAPLVGYSVFVEPDARRKLPNECATVSVSPLLKALIIRAAALPELYPLDGAEARLVSVLLDEMVHARAERLMLPMPADPRIRALVDALIARPGDRATMKVWGARIGVGERTLNRLLVRQTGLSFGRWRQQLHIILALQWLARGASVQDVAADLGYEGASSFVTMFRKAMGTSPGRYMSDRRPDAASRAGEGAR